MDVVSDLVCVSVTRFYLYSTYTPSLLEWELKSMQEKIAYKQSLSLSIELAVKFITYPKFFEFQVRKIVTNKVKQGILPNHP